MANYIIKEINEMKQYLSEQLPDWEKATAEMLLTALSHSDNKLLKETAEWVKMSSKSGEMVILRATCITVWINQRS